MKRFSNGFTIIELLITITIIGILSTISIISFSTIQSGARDSQRSSKITVIAEALEKYYSQNGEYPTCAAITQSPSIVSTTTLKGVDPNALSTPSATSGTNSFICTDPITDSFGYIGGSTSYTLEYRSESTGNIVSVASRHSPLVIAAPSAPVITVTLNGSNVLATITPVTCVTGTVQYAINSRTNDGVWGGYTAWSTNLTATQLANQGVKYGYQAEAQCISGPSTSPTSTGTEGTYIRPITAPATPVVTANTVASTTTWSWPAVTCATGTTARYQYDYTITPSGYNSGWVANGTNISVAFTTSTGGQTYTVAAQAQCYNTNTTSTWSGSGTANYYRVRTWTQIAAGNNYTCAIASDNQAYCWGSNQYGQLGNNSTTDSHIPVAVTTSGVLSGKTIKSITTDGYFDTCVIASDNQAYCWGNGELGNNTTVSLVPVAVTTSGVLSGKTIKSITFGNNYTCVIASDNQAYCWGSNQYGQLGNNSTTASYVPVAVTTSGVLSGKTIVAITAALYDNYTCVIASDNQAYCWGYNGVGELGNNSTTDSHVPVAVTTSGVLSGKTIKSIVAGGYYDTCVIASDNQAYCWGYNADGGLGNNSTTDSHVPVAVTTSGVLSGKTIKSIMSGNDEEYYCVIASDNQAYCWGYGELGNNSIYSLVPVAVTTSGVLSGKTIVAMTAHSGYGSICVIASDNQAYCWGSNTFGHLGNNSTTASYVPVAVTTSGVLSGKTIKSITTDTFNACVIASDNQAYCWGSNTYGQLGNNSTTDSSVPVAVP